MIDLEDALAPLVDLAPDPPDVGQVTRRGRARRRRRTFSLATTLVLVAGVAIGAFATIANHGSPRVAGVAGDTDHVRLTLLDGSQLEVSGPPSLGLTKLQPAFNGSLGPASGDPQWGTLGHGFSVDRQPPGGLGPVVATYPTHDGHDLVVHSSADGVTAVVDYGDWWLSATWSTSPPAQWTAFASELNAKETPDGFLVIEPTDPSWKLGPADAPETQLGGGAYGDGASFAFWGPDMYPAGCPAAASGQTTTAEGWPVDLENGAWWCDATQHVRVAVWDKALVDVATQGLRVSSNDAAHAVDDITTLDGSRYEITAPSTVLDHLILQAAVQVDGIDTTAPIVVQATRGVVDAAPPTYATADGSRLGVVHSRDTDASGRYTDWWLSGRYGDWSVMVDLTAPDGTSVPESDLARIASLFAAHETADGFLVLDPQAPMHVVPGPGAGIVLDQVSVITSQGEIRVEPPRADVVVRRL